MSAAASGEELDPALVDGLIRRANDPRFERWREQVRRTGGCRHPVRLRGVVRRGDEVVYSTADEPDRALLVRCGNRREAHCPSCSREYRGDMWQLVYAGLAGGRKGVPEQVAEHPRVFASLTAPSFGAVHGRPDDGRPCRCGCRHELDDPQLGAPLSPDGYDYDGAVLFNWHAPALWNRFTIELVRVLAAQAGLSERAWRQRVRLAFVKVAEFQARGLVHLHAVIRLDGAQDRASAPEGQVSPSELCAAIAQAAGRAHLRGDAGGGQHIEIRFGEQLDTRVLASTDDGELHPGRIAAYVAKYASKSSHEQITTRHNNPTSGTSGACPITSSSSPPPRCASASAQGCVALVGGCTCSAFADTSSPSPAATPPLSANYEPPAPPTAPTRTTRPRMRRSTVSRPSCCRRGSTSARASSTPAMRCSPPASRPRCKPGAKRCSSCAVRRHRGRM